MTNTKKPFIYTQASKMFGALASSSSTNTIPNQGVTQITAASTYNLAGPNVGSLVTIYCASTVAQGASRSSASALSPALRGRWRSIVLVETQSPYPGHQHHADQPDICVTLIGESTTQWRVMSAWPQICHCRIDARRAFSSPLSNALLGAGVWAIFAWAPVSVGAPNENKN